MSEGNDDKKTAIIVNGQKKEVRSETLTFDQLIGLAFNPVPAGPNIMFTITYRKGPKENREGSLIEGGTVHIKEEMIFNVTATNKS